MTRKTIKEIASEGLTEDIWQKAERNQLLRERNALRRSGRIRAFAVLTPLEAATDGYIKCVGGQTYKIGFRSIKEN